MDEGIDAIITENLMEMDIKTFNPLLNVGGSVVILAFGVIVVLVYFMTTCMSCCMKSKVRDDQNEGGEKEAQDETRMARIQTYAKEKLFFGFFIRNVYGGILQFTLAIIIFYITPVLNEDQVLQNNQSTSNAWISQCASVIFILLIIAIIAVSVWITTLEEKDLKKQEMKTMFGSLYIVLDYRKKQNLYFNIVFIFRKIIISVNTVYLKRYSGIQFIVLLYLNVFILIFIGHYRPMTDRFTNRLEIIYEYFIGLSTMILVSFTQFVSSPRTKYSAGWISLGIFSIHILLALTVNIYSIICVLILYAKRSRNKRNHK